jgi:hypothetical protein
VDVNAIAGTSVAGGDDVGLSLDHEPDMAEIAFVQDRVDLRFVVDTALGEPPHLGSGGGCVIVHALSSVR